MSDIWQRVNRFRAERPEVLVTDTLQRLGYSRYQVRLVNDEEQRLEATVWARSRDAIEELYQARGMLAVYIEPLPFAMFYAQTLPDRKVVGDVIVLDSEEMAHD